MTTLEPRPDDYEQCAVVIHYKNLRQCPLLRHITTLVVLQYRRLLTTDGEI